MSTKSTLSIITLAALALASSGCRISDQRVDEEIGKRGGKIISPPAPGNESTILVGEVPFTVSESPDLGPAPTIKIDPGLNILRCSRYCWETVSRESLDGQPVLDPGTNPPPEQKGIAPDLNARAVNGYHPDVSTAPGKGPDGACDINKLGSSFYDDAPNFLDEDFDKGGRYRVHVLEQETCFRCLNPRGGILGCVKWYYVKVRQDGRPSTIRLVTTRRIEPGPSKNFTDTINAWNQ